MTAVELLGGAARAHLEFAATMHNRLALGSAESVCWSPYSVAATLTLAELGAGGQTRQELRELLGGSSVVDVEARCAFLRAAADLGPAAANVQDPELTVHNTMFVRDGVTVRKEFARALAGLSGSVQPAPFETPEQARKLINTAVEETTRGLIPEAVPPGMLTSATAVALVNALYLKTAWLAPFPQLLSTEEPFHAHSGTRDVPTMHLTTTLGYASARGWQVISLPAAGDVRADLLLPEDPAELDSPLAADSLAALLAAPTRTRVELAMPRLSLDTAVELTEQLGAAGIPTMFSGAADFSGVSATALTVSDVVHSAVLRLDEDGLLGAAATVVAMRLSAEVAPQPPVVVTVDRPFLLLVRHADTGAVYFLATVREP